MPKPLRFLPSFLPQLRWDQYLAIILLIMFFLSQGVLKVFPQQLELERVEEKNIDLVKIQPIPVRIATDSAQLAIENHQLTSLTAESYVVLDLASSAVLLEKNFKGKLYPASTTKMMTALVAAKTYQEDNLLTVGKEAFTVGNTMNLQIAEEINVQQLLSGLLIASANDAAFVLANNHPHGYHGFVLEMNDLATYYHMTDTQFTNPSGLDDFGHQTTAWDLALLAKELLKNPFFAELVQTKKLVVSDVNGKVEHALYNTHGLLGNMEGVKGVKTGTTDLAGEVLVTMVERDSHQVLIVIMASKNRYADTRQLIKWTFANYQWLEFNGFSNIQ